MAAAKKCDICNKLYGVYNVRRCAEETNGVMFVNMDEHGKFYSHKPFDCCPECMKSIRDHVETLKKGVNE